MKLPQKPLTEYKNDIFTQAVTTDIATAATATSTWGCKNIL